MNVLTVSEKNGSCREVAVSGGLTVPHCIETSIIANVYPKSSYCVTLTMM